MKLITSLFLHGFSFQFQTVAAAEPRVVLPSGTVIGTATYVTSPTGSPIHKFLGIPYADSPPERFAPPKDPKPWKTLRTQEFKPACVQQFNYPAQFRDRLMQFIDDPPLEESEDCLYINVFAPSKAKSLPVMLWIYGGTLQTGGAQTPTSDVSRLAAMENVVVVTFNYRTGAFGFSNSPEIQMGKQNSGFLDQRKALKWVHRNIRAFGGDPDRVTIFGQSAGALSVKQLLTLPLKPPLFNGAIMQSLPSTPANGSLAWETLVDQSGCKDAKSTLSCLRQVPSSTIKNISEINSLYFWPVDDNETYTLATFRNPASIPILMGSTANEGTLFSWFFGFDAPGLNVSTALSYLFPPNESFQEILKEDYSYLINDTFAFMSQIQTDLTFTCGVAHLSNLTVGTATWRYYYNASFENLQYFDEAKAYHGSEIPIVFGTYPSKDQTAAEIKMGRYMQAAWGRFARDPANGPGWTRIGNSKDLMVLGMGMDNAKRRLVPRDTIDGTQGLQTLCPLSLN